MTDKPWLLFPLLSMLNVTLFFFVHFIYLDLARFDSNPSRREKLAGILLCTFAALFHIHSIDRLLQLFVTHFAGHPRVCAYTHGPLCGKSHSLPLDNDEFAHTLRTLPVA